MPTSSILIPYNKIDFTGEKLGEGGFGIVKKANWQHQAVAVKELRLASLTEDATEEFEKEAEYHGKLRHHNIVTLFGACIEPGHYCMVMELMPDGSLFNFLHSKKNFQWLRRLDVSKQITIGLNYLHEQKIIHRDLKSLNVLLNGQSAKLADFGLSKIKTETSSTTAVQSAYGSLLWMAPELFKRRSKHNELTDIYALGMVLWEIASRKLPFEDSEGKADVVKDWIRDGEKNDIPKDTPKDFAELIEQCWAQIPESRPQTANSVIESLEQIVKLSEEKTKKTFDFHTLMTQNPHQAERDVETIKLIPATQDEFENTKELYQRHPVEGYELNKVETIYSPHLNSMFAHNLGLLQSRYNNPAFSPKFIEESKKPEEKEWRTKVHNAWQVMAAPNKDDKYPQVKLLPLWHGTSPSVLESILKTGFANLATTDCGYFGKGLYFSCEAGYAGKYYSKGILLLNWVASFSAYPVIAGDMEKLKGQANYSNYDIHFVPVTEYTIDNIDKFVPETLKEFPEHLRNTPEKITALTSQNANIRVDDVFLPCAPNQQHKYIEVVVFDKTQCLPRCAITLQKSLLPSPNIKDDIDVKSSSRPLTAKYGRRAPTSSSSSSEQEEIARLKAELEKMKINSEETRIEAEHNRKEVAATTLLFFPPPKQLTTTVNPQDLTKFLKHIGFGEQAEAEAMLKSNRQLGQVAGELVDCTDQIFNPITGFQYAVWALDYQMWSMLKKYLTKEEVSEQVEELKRIAALTEQQGWTVMPGSNTNNWPSISWMPLITALEDYLQNTHIDVWRSHVGGAQLLLPAHVINEYSHPSRPFYPCPKWGNAEAVLPRTGISNWRTSEKPKSKLGSNFAWGRGEVGCRQGICEHPRVGGIWGGPHGKDAYESAEPVRIWAASDLVAVRELLKTRTDQCARLLLDSVGLVASSGNIPTPDTRIPKPKPQCVVT